MHKLVILWLLSLPSTSTAATDFRPPAVPLVAHDPYFSIWSMADRITDETTRHWTGAEQPISGIARIDGRAFRFLGSWRGQDPPMAQTAREVRPTHTIYRFEQAGIRLELTFLTPALPGDLDVLSRPVTYAHFAVQSRDGRPHQVSLHFDCSSHLAVNTADQPVAWSRLRVADLAVLRVGATEQRILGRAGDNLRIEWGYFYLAVPPQPGADTLVTTTRARQMFSEAGQWPAGDETEQAAPAARNPILLAARFDLGEVGKEPVSRHVLLAYDDLFSIQYLQRNLRPWWRRNGAGPADLLIQAARDFPALKERCRRFDENLDSRLEKAGGRKYADITILAYRQALAAHKLVADIDGTPYYFSKENFSNGCIATVDVTYPSAPLFLALNPELLKGMLTPVFEYARLPRWRWPFAPHDLGTYPLANGQVYGGGEASEDRQMPVEESGNMIILAAAIARMEGNAEYARKYWPLLTRWAAYLRDRGMDPENQLCTDDFAGHLAHNANLSLKAITALGGYAQMARALGITDVAASYETIAARMAREWIKMADDGDHYRLAFDRPGTWSQKYNLVWDRLLGLNLFPKEAAHKEIAYYKTKQKRYGLPLDNRETYTKLDWILWTATLGTDQADFEALVEPVWNFLNESPSRVPMTDWYWTTDGKQRGFQARSVVGGAFIRLLQQQIADGARTSPP